MVRYVASNRQISCPYLNRRCLCHAVWCTKRNLVFFLSPPITSFSSSMMGSSISVMKNKENRLCYQSFICVIDDDIHVLVMQTISGIYHKQTFHITCYYTTADIIYWVVCYSSILKYCFNYSKLLSHLFLPTIIIILCRCSVRPCNLSTIVMKGHQHLRAYQRHYCQSSLL